MKLIATTDQWQKSAWADTKVCAYWTKNTLASAIYLGRTNCLVISGGSPKISRDCMV